MSIPEEFKKELVLSFRFRRVGITWKRAHEQPEVVRLVNHDCSQEYRNPRLIWSPSRLTVEVRIYDNIGIDLTNTATLLGDWRKARNRCEELLEGELRQAIVESGQGAGPAKRRVEVVLDRAAWSRSSGSGIDGATPQGV